jgi:hypothetical protein
VELAADGGPDAAAAGGRRRDGVATRAEVELAIDVVRCPASLPRYLLAEMALAR